MRTLQNVLSLQACHILNKVFSFFFLALAARYLGAVGFGQWSLVFFLIGFFGLLANFGIDKLVIRDVARDLTQSKRYLTNTLLSRVLLLLPASVLFLSSIHIGGYEAGTIRIFYIALPLLFVNALTSPFNAIIQAHERITVISLIEICFGFGGSVGGVTLLLLGHGIEGLVILTDGISVVRLLVYSTFVRRLIGGLWSPPELRLQRYMFKEAFPFAVTMVLAMIYWKVDYYMISKMMGERPLGLYAAAYKIFDAVVMMGLAFNSALYPTISSLYARSRVRVRQVYEKMQRFFTIIALPILAVTVFYAREIILLAYGDQYVDSINVLIVLFSSLSIFAITAPMRLIITNSEYMMKLVPYSILLASLNIVLNYFAIGRFGIIGAALVTLGVGIVDLFVRIYFVRLIFAEDRHPLLDIWKPWLCGAVMILIIYSFSEISKALFTLLGIGVYFLLLKIIGVIGQEEYQMFIVRPRDKIRSVLANRRS